VKIVNAARAFMLRGDVTAVLLDERRSWLFAARPVVRNRA